MENEIAILLEIGLSNKCSIIVVGGYSTLFYVTQFELISCRMRHPDGTVSLDSLLTLKF